MKYIAILFISAMIMVPLTASDRVITDNESFQRFKGYAGLWKRVSSLRELKGYSYKHQTAVSVVKKVNGDRWSIPGYLFIPFGNNLKDSLKSEGKGPLLSVPSSGGMIWPLPTINRISSSFGIRYGILHTGIDFPAKKGEPIVAALDGLIVSAGYSSGHGNSLLIEHRNGSNSRYSHCSVLLAKKGDYVKRGQIIALVGSTGNSTGNHLHFEVRYGEIPLNPLDFLPEKKDVVILRKPGKIH